VSDGEFEALLARLAGRNEAMLTAHAETVRLQRLVLEQMLARAVAPPQAAAPARSPQPPPAQPRSPASPPRAAPPTEPMPRPSPAEPPPAPVTPVSAVAPDPPSAPDPTPPPARPVLRLVPRHDPRRADDAAAPRLATLHRLTPAGEGGTLVLNFGAHKGETLADVARSDPDYLRWLAAKAQRSEVRAAARKLLVLVAQGNRRPHAASPGR
jgi:outer membrane biosynthesis protein TonB